MLVSARCSEIADWIHSKQALASTEHNTFTTQKRVAYVALVWYIPSLPPAIHPRKTGPELRYEFSERLGAVSIDPGLQGVHEIRRHGNRGEETTAAVFFSCRVPPPKTGPWNSFLTVSSSSAAEVGHAG